MRGGMTPIFKNYIVDWLSLYLDNLVALDDVTDFDVVVAVSDEGTTPTFWANFLFISNANSANIRKSIHCPDFIHYFWPISPNLYVNLYVKKKNTFVNTWFTKVFLKRMRSEADSNRCKWFCRPVPNPSAIRPYFHHFGVQIYCFFG